MLTIPDRQPGNPASPRTEQTATTDHRSCETNADCIVVGLINNMPDAAVESTERQFIEIMDAAAADIPVQLRLFSLPDVPRSPSARLRMSSGYRTIDELWSSRIDALIVTGTEPRAACLRDEPYWASLTTVLEWAQENTASTVWSCLAAHAAVLHMDGIPRHLLADKRFGLFECATISHHPLLAGVPARLRIAHSRCNELREDALAACDYTILTRSSEAGVDAFVKQRKSLFVFFQGHPEYDRRALLREYRRDIGRFLRGEREAHPAVPRGYFDPVAVDALARFQERAIRERHEGVLENFPLSFLESRVAPMSRSAAVRIYANWLSYVRARKQLGPRSDKKALRLLHTDAMQTAQSIGR
jgi:homoserine O-succinyltransferase/O-acetyltransferase